MSDKELPVAQNTDGGSPPPGPETTFTQADVDRILSERLAREKAKYADYSDLQAKAAQWEKYEEAQRTELEKAQAEAQRAKDEAARATAQAQAALKSNAVLSELVARGVPGDRTQAALKLTDTSSISIAADGSLEGVAEAVAATLAANAFLIGQMGATPPGLNGGAGGGERPGKTVQLTEEERKLARLSGMTEEEYINAKQARDGLYSLIPGNQ